MFSKVTLIVSLVTISVAGIGTGSYFLLRDASKNNKSTIIQGEIGENGEPGKDTPDALTTEQAKKQMEKRKTSQQR